MQQIKSNVAKAYLTSNGLCLINVAYQNAIMFAMIEINKSLKLNPSIVLVL